MAAQGGRHAAFTADILEKGQAREAIVTLEELRKAPRLWLINSVHGWREARLVV